METKDETNGLLKITAILMIVFAVVGMTVMAWMTWREVGVLMGNMGATIDAGDGAMMTTGMFVAIGAAVTVASSLIGNIPRLIAGIMGLSRCKKPEKHGFFIAWGVVLLVLGVVGLAFSGWVLSANWLASFVGGVILPVCYIIGGLQQKALYIAQKAGEPIVRELTYPTADEVSETDEG